MGLEWKQNEQLPPWEEVAWEHNFLWNPIVFDGPGVEHTTNYLIILSLYFLLCFSWMLIPFLRIYVFPYFLLPSIFYFPSVCSTNYEIPTCLNLLPVSLPRRSWPQYSVERRGTVVPVRFLLWCLFVCVCLLYLRYYTISSFLYQYLCGIGISKC